jgi:hypothetical protein
MKLILHNPHFLPVVSTCETGTTIVERVFDRLTHCYSVGSRIDHVANEYRVCLLIRNMLPLAIVLRPHGKCSFVEAGGKGSTRAQFSHFELG